MISAPAGSHRTLPLPIPDSATSPGGAVQDATRPAANHITNGKRNNVEGANTCVIGADRVGRIMQLRRRVATERRMASSIGLDTKVSQPSKLSNVMDRPRELDGVLLPSPAAAVGFSPFVRLLERRSSAWRRHGAGIVQERRQFMTFGYESCVF